jgi:hypothetical protein
MLRLNAQMHAPDTELALFMINAPVAVTGREMIAPNALAHSAMLMLIPQRVILIVPPVPFPDLNTLLSLAPPYTHSEPPNNILMLWTKKAISTWNAPTKECATVMKELASASQVTKDLLANVLLAQMTALVMELARPLRNSLKTVKMVTCPRALTQ